MVETRCNFTPKKSFKGVEFIMLAETVYMKSFLNKEKDKIQIIIFSWKAGEAVNMSQWRIKYYKGLGTSTAAEGKVQ